MSGFAFDGENQIETGWAVSTVTGANVRATATKTAPGAHKKLVLTSATFTLVGIASTPVICVARIISGATILFQSKAKNSDNNTMDVLPFNGKLVGEVNQSMIIEFDLAGGTGVHQSVAASGFVV